jgi:hypothetical protein
VGTYVEFLGTCASAKGIECLKVSTTSEHSILYQNCIVLRLATQLFSKKLKDQKTRPTYSPVLPVSIADTFIDRIEGVRLRVQLKIRVV